MIMRVIKRYRATIKELRAINEEHREINGRLREENKELRAKIEGLCAKTEGQYKLLLDLNRLLKLYKAKPGKEARLCEVDGRPAFFHRWIEDDRALLNFNAFLPSREIERVREEFEKLHTIPHECSVKVLRATFALVEYIDDGTVSRVRPELVVFKAGGADK